MIQNLIEDPEVGCLTVPATPKGICLQARSLHPVAGKKSTISAASRKTFTFTVNR